MSTIMSLMATDEQVAHVTQALQTAGFDRDRVTVLRRPVEVWQQLGGHEKLRPVFKSTSIGMLLGLALGLFYGIPAGYLNCSIVGCPVVTSLTMVVLISLYWVAGGGFLGALVGLDNLERDLYSYVEGVRRGASLLIVDAPAGQAEMATDILAHEKGTLLHTLSPA